MDFELSPEHEMIVDTVRSFTEKELMPHEAMVGHAGRDMRVDLGELGRWLTESGTC